MKSPGLTAAKLGAQVASNASASSNPLHFLIEFTLDMFVSPRATLSLENNECKFHALLHRRTATATIEMRSLDSHKSFSETKRTAGKNAAPIVAYGYADRWCVSIRAYEVTRLRTAPALRACG